MRKSVQRIHILTGVLLAFTMLGNAQNTTDPSATKTVEVYSARPVADALKIIRERYDLAISYQDPVRSCPCDLAGIAVSGGRPSTQLSLKFEHFRFVYVEANGVPGEGAGSLIKRLLNEYKAQYGIEFEARFEVVAGLKRWEVVPVRARGTSGGLDDQPDVLRTTVTISHEKRTVAEALQEMAMQLNAHSGVNVVFGGSEARVLAVPFDHQDETLSARDLLKQICGTTQVWELFYDPEENGGKYFVNLEWIKHKSATPPAAAPKSNYPERTSPEPRGVEERHAMSPSQSAKIQAKLAQLGYYSGHPSGHWDRKTANAVKAFQREHDLEPTGVPDAPTRALLQQETP